MTGVAGVTSSASGVAGRASALVRAAHPGPAVAVTALATVLAAGAGAGPGRTALVLLTVLAGQLVIGWSNDLVDLERDRRVGRADKPAARGELDAVTLRRATYAAMVPAVVLPVVLGLVAGATAGSCALAVLAGGVAYNLGLKATALSWLSYAVAFGALPVAAVGAAGASVAWWLPVAGALLGVGAHVLNVVPDLADDAATGVRGFPHRLGVRGAAPVGVALLVAATLVMAVGAPVAGIALVVLTVVVAALAAAALLAGGRAAFRAAIAIALVDAVLLVLVQT